MTTDTIPTLAHAVRIGSDLSLYRERERAELVISHAAGGVLVELVDRRDYERERQGRIAAEGAARTAIDRLKAERDAERPSLIALNAGAEGYMAERHQALLEMQINRARLERDELEAALKVMLAIHEQPSGFAGKYGQALTEAIASQQARVDSAVGMARAAIARAEGGAA